MLKPINDYVLVEVKKRETETAGGIILPDNLSKSRFTKGVIQGIGNKVKDAQKGDLIAYIQFKGDKMTVDNKDYHLLKEEDISLILDEDVRIEESM